jgi:formylglycine-generating enzyme required for sulfatase activity
LLEGGGDCTDGARCPVGNVTWFEAAAYANKLSAAASPPLPACYQLDGCTGELGRGMTCTGARLTTPTLSACDGFRLPTGAEWEYFARAGTRGAFYGGDLAPQAQYSTCTDIPALDGTAWYCANSGRLTHPVGAKQPNAWGLHDVLGNAHEWTEDAYDGQSPPPGPAHDPGDGAIGSRPYRIIRGGGATSWSHLLRSACAALNLPWSGRAPTVGFRLVRTIDRQGAAAGEPPG